MSAEFDKKRSALTVSTASIEAYSDELKNKDGMKGWMKKKSPAMLKAWQKRYFMTIENPQGGWKLVYFENDVRLIAIELENPDQAKGSI